MHVVEHHNDLFILLEEIQQLYAHVNILQPNVYDVIWT